jgi:hypothetical protein
MALFPVHSYMNDPSIGPSKTIITANWYLCSSFPIHNQVCLRILRRPLGHCHLFALDTFFLKGAKRKSVSYTQVVKINPIYWVCNFCQA